MNISLETTITPLTHNSCNMTTALLPFDMAMHLFNFLFGLPTHSYIVWLIVTGTGRGLASEFFTLNSSVCEIIFSLRSVISVIATTFSELWDIVMFLSGFIITGHSLFQCLICVERYLAVVHPVTFLKFKPLRYRVVCSAIIWIMAFITSVFSLQFKTFCLISLYTCLYTAQFLLCLFINLFCCLAVLRALKQSGPGERGREREEENNMKRRAFYLILITTATLLITYVPTSLVALQHVLPISAIPELDTISLATFLLAGFVQPLLYIQRVGKLPFCKLTNVLSK